MKIKKNWIRRAFSKKALVVIINLIAGYPILRKESECFKKIAIIFMTLNSYII